jgi:hypothetical protein
MRVTLILSLLAFSLVGLTGCGSDNKKPELPDYERMPLRLGAWEGTDTPLDPNIRAAVAADIVVDRLYRCSDGQALEIPLHLAVFSDLKLNKHYDPMVLYKSCGWELVDQAYEHIYLDSGKNSRVSLSTWKRGKESLVLLFWYQVGDHVVFKESELDEVRSNLDAKQPPPRLVKVQLQIAVNDRVSAAQGKAALKRLATKIREWFDAPRYDP